MKLLETPLVRCNLWLSSSLIISSLNVCSKHFLSRCLFFPANEMQF